jgi:hypothetical protein
MAGGERKRRVLAERPRWVVSALSSAEGASTAEFVYVESTIEDAKAICEAVRKARDADAAVAPQTLMARAQSFRALKTVVWEAQPAERRREPPALAALLAEVRAAQQAPLCCTFIRRVGACKRCAQVLPLVDAAVIGPSLLAGAVEVPELESLSDKVINAAFAALWPAGGAPSRLVIHGGDRAAVRVGDAITILQAPWPCYNGSALALRESQEGAERARWQGVRLPAGC